LFSIVICMFPLKMTQLYRLDIVSSLEERILSYRLRHNDSYVVKLRNQIKLNLELLFYFISLKSLQWNSVKTKTSKKFKKGISFVFSLYSSRSSLLYYSVVNSIQYCSDPTIKQQIEVLVRLM